MKDLAGQVAGRDAKGREEKEWSEKLWVRREKLEKSENKRIEKNEKSERGELLAECKEIASIQLPQLPARPRSKEKAEIREKGEGLASFSPGHREQENSLSRAGRELLESADQDRSLSSVRRPSTGHSRRSGRSFEVLLSAPANCLAEDAEDRPASSAPSASPEQLLNLLSKRTGNHSRSELGRPSSKSKESKTRGRSRPHESSQFGNVEANLKQFQRLEEGQKIFDLYYWEEILQQEGDGGKVVVCRPKNPTSFASDQASQDQDADGFKYVMKIKSKDVLRKDKAEEQFVRAQSRLLNLKAPPGVIQLQEVLEDDNFYYIVMDRATGGSFFSSLLKEHKDGTMPPSAVSRVARDILETLSHLHREGILHRDIKPDNMVMHSHKDGGEVLKVTLIDFDHADADFSQRLGRGQHCFGTARFNAPEAFLGCYAAATDLYSVGVIVYLLLTGSLPYPSEIFEFSDRNPASPAANRRWMQKVVSDMEVHRIDWNHSTFSKIPESRDFCQKLLAFDIGDRIATADEALKHPWLHDCDLQ